MPILMSAPASWEQALPALRNRLVGRARRLGVDPITAEDLAQDALQEAWRLRERVYDPTGVERWLDAIFSPTSTGAGRQEQDKSTGLVSRPPARAADVAEDYDLEVELQRSKLVELVDRALGLLPTGTARDVSFGQFINNLPGELAGQLGLHPGTLHMRLQRGKLTYARS